MTHATNGKIATALIELEEHQVAELIAQQLAAGTSPATLLDEMRQGMNEIGNRFAGGTYFLTDLIMAAEIFGKAMKTIEPRLTNDTGEAVGEVVVATVKGDVHDIGKNVVVAMLRGADFRVHDLGVDVPPQRIIEKIKETGAGVLGLSALLTTSFDSMKTTIDALTQAGLRDRVKVLVGGGPVDERVRAYVGADACGHDAQEAVSLARRFAAVEV